MRHDDAKSYEKLGLRTHVRETEQTKKLLLDDTYENIRVALDKDGRVR